MCTPNIKEVIKHIFSIIGTAAVSANLPNEFKTPARSELKETNNINGNVYRVRVTARLNFS
jgi:hypothetical protein